MRAERANDLRGANLQDAYLGHLRSQTLDQY